LNEYRQGAEWDLVRTGPPRSGDRGGQVLETRGGRVELASLYRGTSGEPGLCVRSGAGFAAVADLASGAGSEELAGLHDVGELFALGESAVDELRRVAVGAAPTLGLDEARYAPPVNRPGKIVCVGLNYADHIAESGLTRPERIVLFAKFPSCLVGHGEGIVRHEITAQLDYEGELAVVIGRRARKVSADEALDVVGGYTIINDVSATDLQSAEAQWIRGKALDTFAPLGPVVVDAASALPIDEMRIRTIVNGEVRQDAGCSQMITSVPELIAHISQSITLEPGDIIATGTPSGVAQGMDPPPWLEPGDTVSIQVTGIGELTNPVVAPR
jgi:2-keto-4-pentenoate hydratase/2-oxohepta-3-ene-1,7-dioic acid hydratase in catechol pathway